MPAIVCAARSGEDGRQGDVAVRSEPAWHAAPWEPITQITFTSKLVNGSRAEGMAFEATPLPAHRSAHVYFTLYYLADDGQTHVSHGLFGPTNEKHAGRCHLRQPEDLLRECVAKGFCTAQ